MGDVIARVILGVVLTIVVTPVVLLLATPFVLLRASLEGRGALRKASDMYGKLVRGAVRFSDMFYLP